MTQILKKIENIIARERSLASHWLRKHVRQFSLIVRDGSLVLDVGCGSLPYKPFFTSVAQAYVGLDISSGGTKVDIIGDICHLPFRENVADVVICTEVLEHVLDREGALRELSRVARQDAHLILSTPLMIGEHGARDYFRFTGAALRSHLKEYGFEVIQLERRGGIFSSLGLLLSNIPGQVLGIGEQATPRQKQNANRFSKWLVLLLSLIFIPVAKSFLLLDRLDRKQGFTLGYDLLCVKRQKGK